MGKLWENMIKYGKVIGKYRKTMGKLMEKWRFIVYSWENQRTKWEMW